MGRLGLGQGPVALITLIFEGCVKDFCSSVSAYEDGVPLNKDLPDRDVTVLTPGPVIMRKDSALMVLKDLGLLCTGDGGFLGLANGGGNEGLESLLLDIRVDSLSSLSGARSSFYHKVKINH